MTMSAIATSQAGLQAATARLDQAAQQISKMADPDSKVDLATETVNTIEAKIAFKANAGVLKTADDMMGSLLDIKA